MNTRHLGLYGRFFAIFTVTTLLLVVLIILGSFSMSEQRAKQVVFDRHAELYRMMVQNLALPIDMEKLTQEAKTNRVQIQVMVDDKTLFTSKPLPPQSELAKHATALGDLLFAKQGSKYYLLAESDGRWITVTSLIANLIVYPGWLVYWPWFTAVLVLFMSYHLLTRQLAPIKRAIESANQISTGNFEHRIETHPRNELGELTKGLNKMAGDLKTLFHAKDELLLAVSHELRSPLARMKVDLALLGNSDTAVKLNQDINKMDLLIEQLLESERLQTPSKALHLEFFFLPKLIDDLMDEFNRQPQLQLTGDVPQIAVEVDVGRVKFLLRNLINNALSHSDGLTPVVIVSTLEQDHLVISVSDQAGGIDSQYLPDIFEPFTRAESIHNRGTQGLGLGLHLCKRIAIAHGGDLTVESELGKGSEFRFYLPLDK